MASEYKLFVKQPTGDVSTLAIPSFLIENRVQLWKAAFADATARVRDEYKTGSPGDLGPKLSAELKERHKKYFNEYFELEGRAYTIVTQTEKAWLTSVSDEKLAELGMGDRTAGIDQLIFTISQIADDEVEPLLKKQKLPE